MAISLEKYKELRKKGLSMQEIKNIESKAQGKDWWNVIDKAGKLISSIFPGKYIGETIGTQIAKYISEPITKSTGIEIKPGPSPLKVAADVGQIGLTLAAPLTAPAKTIAGRVAFGTAIGAGAGVTQAIKEGKPTISSVAGQTIGGGLVGAGISGAFEIVGIGLRALANSKFAQQLASKTYSKALQPKTKELATQIQKGFTTTGQKIADAGYVGGYKSMLSQAKQNINKFSSQLDDILSKYPNIKITKTQIVGNSADDLADVFGALTKQQIATIKREASKLPKSVNLKELLSLKRQLDKKISPTFWIEPDPKKSFVQWVNYIFRKNAKALIENSTDDILVKSINQNLGLAIDVRELAALREAIKEKGRNLIPMGRYSLIANLLDRTIFNPKLTTRVAQTIRGLGFKTGQTGIRQVGRAGIIIGTRQQLENQQQ